MNLEQAGRVVLESIYSAQTARAKRKGVYFELVTTGEIEEFTFGFFGELGYALISYLPFLKHISETQKVTLNTIGGIGTSPFFNFSNHQEVDVRSGDGWGTAASAFAAKSYLAKNSKLFIPTQNGSRKFSLGSMESNWENPNIHINIDRVKNYSTLCYSDIRSEESEELLFKIGKYQVINVKNYYNWGTMDIPNFFSKGDIESLIEKGRARGYKTLLNRFPAPIEAGNLEVPEYDLSGLEDNEWVHDLAHFYDQLPTLSSRNRAQIHMLKKASHIYASQGGNAALSLICGKSVSILMRGGADWPDYMGMSKRYDCEIEICYEIDQMQERL